MDKKTQIKKSALSFPVEFEKIEEVESTDGRFTKVKIWLMHTGKNLNNSAFEKSVVDKAIPTLEYIPIVGFIESNDINEKDFSDHRYIITKDEYGVRRKYMGSSYGVIKSSIDNNAHYETRLCDDGETREFLVVDGILWNMFEDSSTIMNQDIIKSQSMELYEKSIQGYEDDEGVFHFTDFSFRAACILGDDVAPAMTGSTVEVQFSMSDFVESIQSELNDKYTAFTKTINAESTFTKTVNEENNDGGIENMSNTDFTQTVLQQFEDISAMVRQHETYTDRWGYECSRYHAVDVQGDEVIVVDAMNNYNYFGLSFTMNGDKAEIDFESCKRKKISYEDYVEGVATPEGGFDFGEHISKIEEDAFARVEEANAKVLEAEDKVAESETRATEFEAAKNEIEENYNQIKAEFEEMKPKYEDYVQAEQARINAEIEEAKESKIAEYEEALAGNADFEAIKENKAEMTVEEIEGKCAILFAKKNLGNKDFAQKDTETMTAAIAVDYSKDGFVETRRYGFVSVGK